MTKSNSKHKKSNRRTFLKSGATLAAAGSAASLVTPRLSLARSAHVAGSDTIRLGLIGCGGRGRGAAQDAMNTTGGEVRLTAIGDVFPYQAERTMEIIKANKPEKVDVPGDRQFFGFDSYKRVLECDEVDLVILTTPPGFRPLHFEAAVAAGKHIFMEKPVAVDAPGIRRVLAAGQVAADKQLYVGVGLQRRHEPHYLEMMDQLKSGAIGDINFMRAYWNGTTPWVRERKPEQTELEYQMNNWYFFNWMCGDHIVEQHIHNIDVINWLKDDYPVKAQGQGGREVRTGKDHGQIFDHHMIEFTYADGSVMLSQCRHMPGCWNQVAEFAHGSKGIAEIARGTITVDGKRVWKTEGSKGGHQREHDDLFANLRRGEIHNESEYGAKSTMTAIFGRMATYTGAELTWDEAFNSQLTLADVDNLASFEDQAPVKRNEDGSYPVPIPGVSKADVL